MKQKILILGICMISIFSIFSTNCLADELKEKMYLTQILNQINAMQPLIIAAEKA